MTKKIEILSPAGSMESLKAAISAGADAVYVGGTKFSARAYAHNLTEEQLLEAIDYTHLHGSRIYLTINTLLKEKELDTLYNYLLPYYKQGLDAVIVQDIGVLRYVRRYFPELSIHASTQMTITNQLGAKFLEREGVERVVTARELTLAEVTGITKGTKLEVECFVHGALCYCYSGQCLFSSLVGGRSGNRGQCAQPCRLPYQVIGSQCSKEGPYVLSLKDICTLDHIPELVDAGITSFKIEGRMKKPEYVGAVTSMYRKYTDLYLKNGRKQYRVDCCDKELLLDLYNRGGFHDGYYHMRNGKEMVSLARPNHAGVKAIRVLKQQGKTITGQALTQLHSGDVIELPREQENYTLGKTFEKEEIFTFHTHKNQTISNGMILYRTRNEQLLQYLKKTIVDMKKKEKINGMLMLSADKPARLSVSYNGISLSIDGDMVQQALKQPMDSQQIQKQMYRTGNTEFEFESLDIAITGQVFLPLQSLNELRRQALDMLEHRICDVYRRTTIVPNISIKENSFLSKQHTITESKYIVYAFVDTKEQFDAAYHSDYISRIYVDQGISFQKDILTMGEKKKEIYLTMPYIFREDTILKFEKRYEELCSERYDGVLIRNYESYEFLLEHQYQKPIILDYNMYHFNTYSQEFWREKQVEEYTASVELNDRELQALNCESAELIVYGYLPMMISAQCIQKNTDQCTHQNKTIVLKDRVQKEFKVKSYCEYCYNVIYNCTPVVLLDSKIEIDKVHPKAIRLQFTTEQGTEIQDIITSYGKVFIDGQLSYDMPKNYTRGHFKRGVK
ncbi:MAG: U32 family peptidase [Lachnospiraceae bacterium]